MKIRGNEVLIERDMQVSKSGLAISKEIVDSSKLQKGKVFAVGTGQHQNGVYVPVSDLNVGDEVMYRYWEVVKIGDKEYDLVGGDDVKVVL